MSSGPGDVHDILIYMPAAWCFAAMRHMKLIGFSFECGEHETNHIQQQQHIGDETRRNRNMEKMKNDDIRV